jgi:hypothetical protein
MDVFTCAECGAALTAPVSRVVHPSYARSIYGNGVSMPVLMAEGTYSVDAEPFGPPWRKWNEIDDGYAEAVGVFAPVHALSCGTPGPILLAPGDAHGTVLIPERNDGFCCGLDGRDGPNLACAGCRQEVGTRIDDCSLWQATWLEPSAVRRVPIGPARPVADWESLAEERHSTPPISADGRWNPRWEATVAVTLAHLVAASGGSPVTFPDGPAAEVFGRFLAGMLPADGPARRAVLAGPRLPVLDRAVDIAVVPQHPQTGEPWPVPPGVAAVPLAVDVWMHLAFRNGHPRLPATGALLPGVERDDLLPPRALRPLYPVDQVFFHTLARLPAVRQPWLRAIHARGSALYGPARRGGAA